MQELTWLVTHLGGDLQNAVDRANRLWWNLSVLPSEDGARWTVYSGDQAVLKAESQDSVDAFLYGIGLAYAVLPDHLFAQLRDSLKGLIGD